MMYHFVQNVIDTCEGQLENTNQTLRILLISSLVVRKSKKTVSISRSGSNPVNK